MSASEITEPLRLSLTLDPGLVLERLILRRLSGLKRRRGKDWLRSLLVQGFLAEGQWIRTECPRALRESRIPTSPFASWLKQTHAPPRQAVASEAPTPVSPVTTPASPVTGNKPFAYLRKVIGP